MSTTLTGLSDALADAAESAAASALTVNARRRLPATGIAWAADVVVTANHVVEQDEGITIVTPAGESLPATLAGRDPGTDIAVLRVEGANLTPAALAQEGSARVGHLVLALGRVTGAHSVSLGVVGSLGGPWRTFRGSTVPGYIRSDAVMLPGFSGGPLVATDGTVLGMNSSALGAGEGLAIPAHAIDPIVQSLLSQGRVRRAYLGISTQAVRLPAGTATNGQDRGLLVVGVEEGSPASTGGVLVGDIIVRLAGATIASTDDLQEQLGSDKVGVQVELQLLRGGQPHAITVTPRDRG